MNHHDRAIIRAVLLDKIRDVSNHYLIDLAEWQGIDPFEAMEYYEQQAERVETHLGQDGL